MNDEVLKFIQKRFKKDCNWMDGNCYYFSIILKERFSNGKIYYDVIDGHFVFLYQNQFYDWTGIVDLYGNYNCLIEFDRLVEWDRFDEYDSLLKQRIIRDCIM